MGVAWYFYFSFFFFKQKTAYEMRISDWSSDVCSSDLFDRNDRQSGLRASLGAFTGQVFHSFGDDLVVHIDYSISVEFIYTGADFGTDSITAACGLIDNHLQPF